MEVAIVFTSASAQGSAVPVICRHGQGWFLKDPMVDPDFFMKLETMQARAIQVSPKVKHDSCQGIALA
jgi:hypothetical protein